MKEDFIMAKNSYGELYFIGPCNFNCYFCLGREMYLLQKDTTNMLRTHYSEWDGFYEWIDELKQDGITKIYLSSTNTEPTLYKYLDELVDLLQETHGFKVGIRSNASTLTPRNIGPVLKMNEEISLSLQSFTAETFTQITGKPLRFDVFKTLDLFRQANKTIRCTIVVNQYNFKEVISMLETLSAYTDVIEYVQLRKFYKYDIKDLADEEVNAWNYVKEKITAFDHVGNYYESPIYAVNDLSVSLWETVFSENSIRPNNYWVNGVKTKKTLLVEGYDDGRKQLKK